MHDEGELERTIRDAAAKPGKHFFVTSYSDPAPCQGDVLEFDAAVPAIGAEGKAGAVDTAARWLVVANSCDVSRLTDTDDVEYVPLVPLFPLDEFDFEEDAARDVKSYRTSRLFFVPSWDGIIGDHVADFTKFVSVHRDVINSTSVTARMEQAAWILLNACLVRLLCRRDNRFVA